MSKSLTSLLLKYFIALFIFFATTLTAKGTSYGCNLGNEIYPNATGGVNSTGYPTYYNSNPITIRWWDGDTRCGIRDNKISMRTNTEDKCFVLGNNWGVVYKYNPADNNCIVLPIPLDDYAWVIIIGIGSLGAFIISRKVNLA